MEWRSANLQEKGDLLREIHAIEPHQRFDNPGASVEILPLPFYIGGLMVRCRQIDWREGGEYLWYVKLPEQPLVALDGSVANIHHLNFRAHLHLNPAIISSYLKFRLYFGMDDGPRRHLAEGKPVSIEPVGADFICTCHFYEEDKLYAAHIKVTSRGEIEFLEKKGQTAPPAPPRLAEFKL